jgi:hypothetical protein
MLRRGGVDGSCELERWGCKCVLYIVPAIARSYMTEVGWVTIGTQGRGYRIVTVLSNSGSVTLPPG